MRTDAPTRTPAEVADAVFAALSTRDIDEVLRYVHEDCVDDFVVVGMFRGRAAIRVFYDEMFAAFPDFVIHPLAVVADDRRAAVQWVVSATFIGEPFLGIRATGSPLELRGLDLMEIEDGLVRHNTIYYDGASFARQVGLLPAQGSVVERGLVGAANAWTRLRSLPARGSAR